MNRLANDSFSDMLLKGEQVTLVFRDDVDGNKLTIEGWLEPGGSFCIDTWMDLCDPTDEEYPRGRFICRDPDLLRSVAIAFFNYAEALERAQDTYEEEIELSKFDDREGR